MVLFISRVREYGADAFSVKLTRKPEALIRALAKIGYGLLDTEKQQNRKRLPIDALQIQNSSAGREMACWVGEDSPVRFDLRKTFMNS
jgi:Zn-dependent protease with chaperone function